jgi:hypothetical protein
LRYWHGVTDIKSHTLQALSPHQRQFAVVPSGTSQPLACDWSQFAVFIAQSKQCSFGPDISLFASVAAGNQRIAASCLTASAPSGG